MSVDHTSSNRTEEILIVDDELANLQLLSDLLSNAGYGVRPTRDPQLAIESTIARQPDLILLDVKMAEMDGFEVCRQLKQIESTRDIPILFVSALTDMRDRIRCFEVGGVDFISKPFQEQEVLARVRTHLVLRSMQAELEDHLSKRSAELVESQASLQDVQSKAKLGSWCLEVESDKVTWSPMLYEIMGIDPNKPPPVFAEHPELFTAESWERLTRTVEQALKDGEPYLLELDIVHPDGNVRHTLASGHVIKDENGHINKIIGTTQDITERTREQQRLLASEENYRMLVDTALVGVFHSQVDGRLTFVNEALVQMFEFSNQEEMISQGTLVRWSDLAQREQLVTLMQRDGEVKKFEAKTVTAKGRKIVIQISATLQGDQIRGMVADITEEKKAEKAVLKHQKRLRAMSSELIFTEERERQRIATELHDGPAQSLALARMQLAEATDAAIGSEAEIILDEASQQVRLSLEQIRSVLLDLSSPTLHQMGLSAGISEWLDDNVRNMHGLKTVFCDDCGDVELADEMRLLLFRNVCELLTNVIKHGKAQRIFVHMSCVGQTLEIVVEDDGVGFDSDAEGSHPDLSGGFGLFSIVGRMADMGGFLEIVSAPGKGCKATLIAPFAKIIEKESQ